MMCSSPSRMLVRKKTGEEIEMEVPCGRCIQCRIARSREWVCRLTAELSEWDDACFITLTFSDENLTDLSLDKSELQRFFKRLRKSLGERKIKYYACGEYGDTLGRKHYHAIVYGLSVKEGRKLVSDSWPYGRVSVDLVIPERISYVAGYVQKKLIKDKVFVEEHDGLLPPFMVASKGLGASFCDKNAERLMNDLYVRSVDGKVYALPRYYKKRLGIPSDVLMDFSIQSKVDLMHQHGYYRFDENDSESVNDAYMWFILTDTTLPKERIQSTKNALAKRNLGKRKIL